MQESVPAISSVLIDALRNAKEIAVLTGAGISAESGIPTFRDAQSGLWGRFKPEDLATPEAFQRNPKLVWEWYAWRREQVLPVQPNPGHLALARMEQLVPGLTIITQNVDGLHRRAGSKNVLELHGNISRVKCFRDGHIVESWQEDGDVPPHCPDCGALLRPDVVWFGELLPEDQLNDALAAAASCDVFLSVGTSGLVEPAASLPRVARRCGGMVVCINPDSSARTHQDDIFLQGPAGRILPALVAAVWPDAQSI